MEQIQNKQEFMGNCKIVVYTLSIGYLSREL